MIVKQENHGRLITGLALMLSLVLIWALMSGETAIKLKGLFSPTSEFERSILFNIRLPRILLAALVGAGLAVSGTAIQGVFRNPLADPALIGVSAGAALFAALAMVLVQSIDSSLIIPMAAFLGGLLTTALVYKIATLGKQTGIANLLLAGIAVNALVAACLAMLGYIADAAQLRKLVFWTMGSLSHADWKLVFITAVFVVPALILLPRKSTGLNLLLLGEKETGHLGHHPETIKRWTIVFVALAVGTMVAATGVIGFIGLVVPHLGRLLVGPDHRILFPVAALLGAVLLMLADWGARTILSPIELPVGILTAVIGVPFFLWLLVRSE